MPVFIEPEAWAARLIAGGESQIGQTVRYDPAYERLAYPQGDVPLERGVCTDVIVRAYRSGSRHRSSRNSSMRTCAGTSRPIPVSGA